jgi:hypothetical protein
MNFLHYALLAAALSTPVLAQDAVKEAAIDRLFVALNADQLYTGLGNQTLSNFAPLIQMNLAKRDQVIKIIEGEVVPELKASRPAFTKALKAAYAKRFTTEELNAATAFLTSTTGKKLSQAQLEVPREASSSLDPLQKRIGTVAVPKILAKMKAAGMKVPPPPPVAGK